MRKEAPPDMEIIPGVTKKELEARMAAESGRDTRTMEVIPRVTLDDLNTKRGREVRPEKQELLPQSRGK